MLQEFVEEIRKTVNEECMGLHTALPAKVEAVRDGRVDARPYGKYRTSTGQLLDWPVIPSVPVTCTSLVRRQSDCLSGPETTAC